MIVILERLQYLSTPRINIAIILSTITLTFSINNTILLLNFISIIRLGSFMSMIVELINLTLLVILVYIGVSSILSLVNSLV